MSQLINKHAVSSAPPPHLLKEGRNLRLISANATSEEHHRDSSVCVERLGGGTLSDGSDGLKDVGRATMRVIDTSLFIGVVVWKGRFRVHLRPLGQTRSERVRKHADEKIQNQSSDIQRINISSLTSRWCLCQKGRLKYVLSYIQCICKSHLWAETDGLKRVLFTF